MSIVRVLRAGLSTTVQDLGRPTLREYGVPCGGAMDRLSHELANRLVGNPATAATLEMTLTGDELEWPDGGLIAITGADMMPVVCNGGVQGGFVPLQTPVLISPGRRIRFGTARRGCRCYVAVAEGFDVPEVMGSRATYLRALLGGFLGRTLQAGDEIPVGFSDRQAMLSGATGDVVLAPKWFVRLLELPDPAAAVSLRAVRGTHFDLLSTQSQASLWSDSFLVSARSDRMGYRLSGNRLATESTADLLSEGTAIGTLQLPPDGDPILLMADSAPTGGYARIAHVITADLPLAAQLRPGQMVHFKETTIQTAHAMLRQQRNDLEKAMLRITLQGHEDFR